MSSTLNDSTEPASQTVANDYDSFAEAYATDNESNLINAHYALPAILNLAGDVPGDVAGRRVLDVGCGSGPVLAPLHERGAVVTGVDNSVGMLELAKRRLGDGVDLRVADLGRSLPFPDGAFDDVIACLVLHYLRDWEAPLAELRRVLVPGGRLIVAVNHPMAYRLAYPDADYFGIQEYSEEYVFNGQNAVLTYWHRPLRAMTAAFTEAGFRIAVVSEPPPAPGARELFPDILGNAKSPDASFICFLFFVLEAA
ncbi:class I SAM-dependent methyltransferase [Rugosimonospora africana]|uniref:Methyltransferase n=1 Tax=Rugosimonospora africana TaxID=556532 RepID=A0A8J3QUL1_9ACTN|nr:class I SAM-dependent methyltransferase [Rugosimonospora africana]GIH15126.1 methyltransferase [Rugosimonospora africana]